MTGLAFLDRAVGVAATVFAADPEDGATSVADLDPGAAWTNWTAWAALAIFLVAFGLIASERVSKVRVVLVAAGAMAVLGLIPGNEVFYNHAAGIDWDVIFLLFGMMVIVGVLKQTGLFDFLGIWAAQVSKGRPYALMIMLMIITAIASPFIDNVTTIMLVVPVTIVVARRLHIAPQPYIIAEILASNIGGASTLIGDPPNIIIGTRANLSFMDFVVHMAPIVGIIFVAFVLFTRLLFRKWFEYHPEHVADVMSLNAKDTITDTRLLVRCLVVLGGVILAFGFHSVFHVAPSIVAMVGAGVMLLVSRVDAIVAVREVEWHTLVFFMGLFVMVAGLVSTGVIGSLGSALIAVVGDDWFLGSSLVLWGSAVFGSIFDNIPYVATMAPIVEGLVGQVPPELADQGQAIWWAFALGACFSGNGSAIAASANVVGIGLAQKAGHQISFWQFTRYGIVVTLLSAAMAWGWVWLRYFS